MLKKFFIKIDGIKVVLGYKPNIKNHSDLLGMFCIIQHRKGQCVNVSNLPYNVRIDKHYSRKYAVRLLGYTKKEDPHISDYFTTYQTFKNIHISKYVNLEVCEPYLSKELLKIFK